jgi:hypothetical protein
MKKNKFLDVIKGALKNHKIVPSSQNVARVLFDMIRRFRGEFSHGGLRVDKATWKRLKALKRQAERMRRMNRSSRTSGR